MQAGIDRCAYEPSQVIGAEHDMLGVWPEVCDGIQSHTSDEVVEASHESHMLSLARKEGGWGREMLSHRRNGLELANF